MSPAMPTLRQLTPPASLLADRPGGISAIGGTAVVRLARMADDSCAEVWVKMEAANPTGSLDAGGTIHLCRLRARREASTMDAN